MATFFGIEESQAKDFVDKGILCIPCHPDGKLDLHAVVSAVRNQDVVFIKHCDSELVLHIKAVGVVQSEYVNQKKCLPVEWLWQGEKVPVNVDETDSLICEPFYEEHNIMVQREIVNLLNEINSSSQIV
jgi:hypothetical protein